MATGQLEPADFALGQSEGQIFVGYFMCGQVYVHAHAPVVGLRPGCVCARLAGSAACTGHTTTEA